MAKHFSIFKILLINLLLQCLLLQWTCASNAAQVLDLIVIGDSTAANYTRDPTAYPKFGWAMFLQDHFKQSADVLVQVRDLAVSGRSSKSFYDEKLWEQVKFNYLSAGDYVFIQFGHNDQKSDPERHTDPFTTYKEYLTIYIKDARAAMANPVLLTSISRAVWYNGALSQTLGSYPTAVRQLAQELQVPLIDLNEETAALFSKFGEKFTQTNLFMCLPAGKYPNYPNGIYDTSHLQMTGAKLVAALAARDIVKVNLPIQTYLQNPSENE